MRLTTEEAVDITGPSISKNTKVEKTFVFTEDKVENLGAVDLFLPNAPINPQDAIQDSIAAVADSVSETTAEVCSVVIDSQFTIPKEDMSEFVDDVEEVHDLSATDSESELGYEPGEKAAQRRQKADMGAQLDKVFEKFGECPTAFWNTGSLSQQSVSRNSQLQQEGGSSGADLQLHLEHVKTLIRESLETFTSKFLLEIRNSTAGIFQEFDISAAS